MFHWFGFRLISCFCVDRFLFRFGGRFLRPQRAFPLVNEIAWLEKISASNPDPRVLVTWVKKICRLSMNTPGRESFSNDPSGKLADSRQQ